jgi:TatD-related deoxyribonuclease
MHLRRDGLYLDAIRKFEHAGGTHIILCQYPMPNLVRKYLSYLPVYKHTLDMASEIVEQTDVDVFVTVGPYPVDYLRLVEWFDRDTSIGLMKQGMDEAAQLFSEHNLIVGIGEIGRPHFPVDAEAWTDSNNILQYGMKKAKEVGAPVIIHTESTTPTQCQELVQMGRKVGLPANRIVKHFAPPLITNDENFGILPSVLARKKNIELALEKGSRFMMETDYIDDLRRPGAVLDPKTVPKITKAMFDRGLLSVEQWSHIHIDLPKTIYGIELE